jgi:hypothetical protein
MEPEDEKIELVEFYIDQQVKLRAMYENKGLRKMLNSQNFAEIIKSNEKFEDDLFPPNNGSIYDYVKYSDLYKKKALAYKNKLKENNFQFSPKKKQPSPKKEKPEKSNKKEWKRLSELYPDYSVLNFSEEIKEDRSLLYKDINQGDLGDCYFLCALVSICEFPDKITKIFRENKINKKGVVEVGNLLNQIDARS